MIRVVFAGVLLFSTACVDGTPASVFENDDDSFVTEGGSFRLDDCGYTVTTRSGASAPVLGEAQLGDDAAPRLVHLGIAGDASTSMVVQWRTVDETSLATTVQFGEGAGLAAAELDQSVDGLTFVYVADFSGSVFVRMHETHLCGLSADTEYSYRAGGIGADGTEVWSDIHTFRTAPDPSDTNATVVFGNLGDSRDGYDIWEQLMDVTASYDPDLILFSGDAVTIGAVQAEWESFFGVAEDVLAEVPMISAHGNHDVNSVHYYSQFALPGDESDYSLRYGPAFITVLNDTPLEQANLTGLSPELLDTDMGATDAPWKILLHHRPIFSASTRHGTDETLKDAWQPIIDRHHVDLVLNGHDHNYERSKIMKGDAVQIDPADGTIYIVAGGAGASLYGNGTDFWTEFSEKTYSTAIITITGSMSLALSAYREDGTLVDEMPTIVKP